jgi:SAM-dependent methyltransferase
MRSFLHSLVEWSSVDSVLDLGCGKGYDLFEMAKLTNPNTRLVGLDSEKRSIEEAQAKAKTDQSGRFSFFVHDLGTTLPFTDQQFDVVFCSNVLECITDKMHFLSEVKRVLKPGGQFLCAHFDWDTQVLNSSNKALTRKILHSFADWQQPWMQSCDGWMGRRLWANMQDCGLFEGKIFSYIINNTKYEAPYYGFARIKDFAHLVDAKLLQAEEYRELLTDIEGLAERNHYFYSITMYAFMGRSK